MGIQATSGEFSYSVTSSTFERQAGGGAKITVNLEGTATGYGRVTGTLTFNSAAPGATAGTGSYTGAAFLDSGEVIGAQGEGYWQQVAGKQQWRVRGINQVSTGAVIVSDGTLDLASRSFQGTLAEWT
jgi:hypothetical protein